MSTERDLIAEYNRRVVGTSPFIIHLRWLMSRAGIPLLHTALPGLVPRVPIRPEHRVLDIGCGSGSVLRYLRRRVPLRVAPVGLDASLPLLRWGHSDEGSSGRTPIAFCCAGATALPFQRESFDVAVSAYLVKHLDDADVLHFFREVRRVLKLGGALVFWEFRPVRAPLVSPLLQWVFDHTVPPNYLRAPDALSALLAEAGFARVERPRRAYFLYPPVPRACLIART